MKAAEARFLADKGVIDQEKSEVDRKLTEIKMQNEAEMKKEKAIRKLEDVRLEAAKLKTERLADAVESQSKHLRMKLAHASELQQKAVHMENKEKVQPDVIHQIISTIKVETLQAVSLNKALKLLKERETEATHQYAKLQDETFAKRARRGEKARDLVANLENSKAQLFANIHTETKSKADDLWNEADNGIAEIRGVVNANQASRKRGEHLTGPLNEFKDHLVSLLGSRSDVLNTALAISNTATENLADRAAINSLQQVGSENFLINPQPSYPIKPVVPSNSDVEPSSGATGLQAQMAPIDLPDKRL